jgi:glycosyltransferase involved in cell wall biosynthesis
MAENRAPVPVMFVVPCFGYGGLEQVVLYLIKQLDRSAFRPSFCTLDAPDPGLYAQLQAAGVDCFVLEKGPGVNYGLPIQLARIMRQLGVRLVNGHDIGATFYACLAARLAGGPRVIHTEHSQVLTLTSHLPLHRWLMQHWVHYSIAVSSELARQLWEKLRIPREQITFIPNAVDTSRFASGGDGKSVRKLLGLSETDFVVGTIGRLTKQKGQSDLLNAFPAIVAKRPDSKLVIVGDGELRSELEALAMSIGIFERVIFAGNRRDIPELLNAFDVFALPSLWEGQPMVLMEAMAAGKVIVASNVGDNGTLLGSGERGMLVDSGDVAGLADAIGRVATDPTGAAEFGTKAQSHALQAFSAASMVRRHEQVFSATLASRT